MNSTFSYLGAVYNSLLLDFVIDFHCRGGMILLEY